MNTLGTLIEGNGEFGVSIKIERTIRKCLSDLVKTLITDERLLEIHPIVKKYPLDIYNPINEEKYYSIMNREIMKYYGDNMSNEDILTLSKLFDRLGKVTVLSILQ